VSPLETIFLVAVIAVAIGLAILILDDVGSERERRSREEHLIAAVRRQARRRPVER